MSDQPDAVSRVSAPPLDLEAIKTREAAATNGPWTNGVRGSGASGDAHMCRIIALSGEESSGGLIGMTWDPEHIVSYVGFSRQQNIDNAEFIAHARQDVPMLIAEVERLRASASSVRVQELDHVIGFCRQTARDGILPTLAWFTETADTLEAVRAAVPVVQHSEQETDHGTGHSLPTLRDTDRADLHAEPSGRSESGDEALHRATDDSGRIWYSAVQEPHSAGEVAIIPKLPARLPAAEEPKP